MSLRHLFSSSGLFIVLGLAIGISAQASASTKDSAVQTYTDQALPINAPATEAFQNAPLPAGSLTMEDVLRAHEPKDEPEPHAVPAATGLMMSQGMNSIFQRYKVPAIPKPIKAAPAMQPQAEIKVTAAPAAGGAQPKSALTAPTGVNYEAGQAPKNLEVAAEPVEKPERDKAETTYQPGQAPKNLAAAQADVLSPGPQASSPEPTSAKCTEKVQKWEKSCSEAGYPVTYVGKVYGETHTVCADGSLQDVWVKNTCLPPQEKPETTAPATASKQAKQQRNETFLNAGATPAAQASSAPEKKNPEKPKEVPSAVDSGKMAPASVRAEASLPRPPEPLPATSEEYCGEAAETLAYEAPEKNLCRVGAPSTVTGKGPWSWTCTNNTGAVSSCRTLSLGSAEESSTEPTPKAAPALPVSSAPSSASAKARFLRLPSSKAPPIPSMPAMALSAPTCGSSADQPSRAEPTSNLCETGKASAVHGQGPWNWTCSVGKKKVSCGAIKMIDGTCGSAEGLAASTEPSKNLCKKGIPSTVAGGESWTWACGGSNGGNDASCAAPKKAAGTPSANEIPVIPAIQSFKRPQPTEIPKAVEVTMDKAPEAAPKLPENTAPVPPPTAAEIQIPKAKKAKGPTVATSEIPAPVPSLEEAKAASPKPQAPSPNKLTLDPTLSTVLFTHLAEDIDAPSRVALDKLAAVLKNAPKERISLIAYADGAGLAPHAVHRLSLARALAIRSYLTSKGIPEGRIDVQAEGASAPTGYPDRVDIKVSD